MSGNFSPSPTGDDGRPVDPRIPHRSVEERYRLKLADALCWRNSTGLIATLDALYFDSRISPNAKVTLANSYLGNGAAIVHHVARHNLGVSAYEILKSIGADLTIGLAAGASGDFAGFAPGTRALHIIASYHPDHLKRFLRSVEVVDTPNENNETPFNTLVLKQGTSPNFRRYVSLFLERRAAPSASDLQGTSPLSACILRSYWDVALLMANYEIKQKQTHLTQHELSALLCYAIANQCPDGLCKRLGDLYHYAKPATDLSDISQRWCAQSLGLFLRIVGNDDRDGSPVLHFLQRVQRFLPSIPSSVRDAVANGFVMGTPSLFYLIDRPERSVETIAQCLKLGVSATTKAARLGDEGSFQYRANGTSPAALAGSASGGVTQRVTGLHVAALEGDAELAEALLKADAPPDPLDGQKSAPLRTNLARRRDDEAKFVRVMLEHEANPNQAVGFRQESLVELALRRAKPLSLHELLTFGGKIPARFAHARYLVPSRGEDKVYDFEGATARIATLVHQHLDLTEEETDRTVFKNIRTLLRETKDLQLPLLLIEAYVAGTYEVETSSSHAFTELLPHLIGTKRLNTANALVEGIDLFLDSHPELHHKPHPNAAEMLALISNPDLEARDQKVLSLALTSPHRWDDLGVKSIDRATEWQVWSAVGQEIFNFRRWTYDVQGVRLRKPSGEIALEVPSLLERFGFQRLPPNQAEASFGAAFLLNHLGKNWRFIDFARGEKEPRTVEQGLVVIAARGRRIFSHPEYGTILYRNSSTVFGRDTLPHPAYYCDAAVGEGFNLEDLIELTPQSVESLFLPIFDLAIFKNGRTARQLALQQQARGVDQLYSAWKCDTRAEFAFLRDDGMRELIGGPLSPGFEHVVAFLERRQTECKRFGDHYQRGMPDLAFVAPFSAPWRALARLETTPEVIAALRAWVEQREFPEGIAEADRVWEFFSIGFRRQADLLLTPRTAVHPSERLQTHSPER